MNCPHCQRLLYSRRRKTCGYCGGELPADVLLSDGEIAKLKAEQQAIEVRRAKARKKDDEEEKERRKKSADTA